MTRQYDNYGRDQYNVEYVQGNVTFNQTQIIQIAVAEIKTRPLNPTSPYRGLKPFAQTDKDYFFGRDQFLTGLVNELEQTNVILLLGASGSGKSSVVRAGLLPWLAQKWGSRLIDLTLTPDHDPFEALYGSLLKHYKQFEAQRAQDGNADTLSQVVQTLKQPESFWLIFIDQFEELFTTSQPEKRDRFIQSLVQLSQGRSNDPSLKIVATMRADFLDRLDLTPANRLARITEHHRPLMTQMHPDELRLAIEQPAARHGVVFEAELVETIIKDVQGQAGYLPLLQYTLNRLWEEELQTGDLQQERTLHTTTYWRLGGVRGALQKHVDTIYERLQRSGNHLATQRIFLKLVEIGGDAESGTDWKPVRRRANRAEFKDEQEKTVLAQLIDEKLVVSDRDLPAQTQESTVEIAHEILLTSWSLLNTWIKENRQALALRNRLNDDVARWQAKQTDDELWTGSKLEQVLELKNDPTFNDVLGGFSATANQFIDASEGKRDRQIQAEIEHQRQQKRLYRRVAIGAIAASACIAGVSIFAGWQWQQAEAGQRSAIEGQIQALTTSSKSRFTENRYSLDSLLDALEAGGKLQQASWIARDAHIRLEVMEALAQSVNWVREQNRLDGHSNLVQRVRFNPDGQLIGTASYDYTAKLWSLNGRELRSLTGHSDVVTDIAFTPDSQLIATASQDKTVKIWDRSGKALETLTAHTGPVWKVNFSLDGQWLITASEDKTAKLWQRHGNHFQYYRTLTGHTAPVYSAVFSPDDNQVIATASADKTAKIWKLKTDAVVTLTGHTKEVLSIIFSPDGKTLATAGNDNVALLWNRANEYRTKVVLKDHVNGVTEVGFSPDSEIIATASKDRNIRIWSNNGILIDTFRGHETRINSISFNQDGSLLASAANEKTVRIWQVINPSARVIGQFGDTAYRVSFSPDGQRIVGASLSTIQMWSSNGKRLSSWSDNSPIYAVAFDPTGNIMTSSGNNLKMWTRTGQLQKLIKAHSQPVLSVAIAPDGQEMITASVDQTIKFWKYPAVKLFRTIKAHNAPIYNIRYSPDGQQFATASLDGTVKIWARSNNHFQLLKAHRGPVYSLSFSLDSQYLATAGEDNLVKLWTRDGKLVRSLKGHSAGVMDVAFNRAGWLATASNDKTIKIWQPDGKLALTLNGHDKDVNSINFSPDGKVLVSISSDKTIALWNMNYLTLQAFEKRGCGWLRNYWNSHENISSDCH
ncbi:MAG: AAA family ATPase [Stenomitos rutilans HA7619-LM2]|jgi:WD40 repeat protein|nr:AAA family ATPase [Stenomitos rutilans HA7619-LM2]